MDYNGIDLSFSILTDQALADPKVEIVTQDLWTGLVQPAPRVINLRRALQAGKKIAGYFAVSSSHDGPYHARMARQGVPDDLWAALECVWCDVELDGVDIRDVRAAVDAMAGMTRHANIIYTRREFWEPVYSQAKSDRLRDCLLVDARYGGRPFVPYGCWDDESRVLGVQVTGETVLGGSAVDLDLMDLSRLEEPMTAEEKAAFAAMAGAVKDIRLQLNDLGNALNVLPPIKDQLRYLYALGGKPWPFGG